MSDLEEVNERRCRSVIESLDEGIAVMDEELRVVVSNSAAETILGAPPGGLLGSGWRGFIPPQEMPVIERQIAMCRRGEKGTFELDVVRGDGAQRKILATAVPQLDRDGRLTGILGIFRDITEPRQMEERIRLLAHALGGAGDCICITDAAGYIKYVNEAALRTYGYQEAEFLGQHVSLVHLPSNAAEVTNEILPATMEGGWRGEVWNRTKDGREFPVSLATSVVRDERGQAIAVVGVARDITETKRVEQALRESEEKFRKAFLTGADAFYIATLDEGLLLDVNDCFADVFGYTRDEALGKTSVQLGLYVDPADRERMVSEVRSKGYLRNMELRGRKKGGELITVLLSANKLLMDGSQQLILGVARDITHRKRAEEVLREREQELKEAQRMAKTGSWMWDVEAGTVTWSEELYRANGRDRTLPAPNYRELEQLYTPESWERIRGAVEETLQNGTPYELEVEAIRADGQRAWRSIRGEALRDASGRIVKLRGTSQDLTERIQTEQKVRSLATAIEEAGEEVVITDAEGNIEYCNPAFERITGYSKDEVVGQNPRVLKSGKQTTEFYERLWGAIKSGKTWTGHFTNKKKDGSLYEEDATIAPIHDASGQITGFVAVKRDVTERLNLEAQLQQAQKLESIGRLAGGVAHDFNNLLTVINGYCDLVLKELKPADPLRDSVAEIRSAGGRAADLTQQLLAFSRKQVVKTKPLNLNDWIGENRDMLQRLVGEDIELVTVLDPSLGRVMADRGQLHQVLMNLAVNAKDAMPGGGNLAIRTANVEMDRGFAAHPEVAPGPYILLAIGDSGTGIDKETLPHIFEPFFTSKGEGKGTGLGLSTVYGIVRQSGGWIEARSEPGQGATFQIYLPRVEAAAAGDQAAAAGDQAAAAAPATMRGWETVLVVEDQEKVRRLAVAVLKSCGYRVLEAAEGGEALLLAKRYPEAIHLMLTDVVMPHMSGKELAERLKGTRPGMRVLYMSGYPANVLVDQGAQDAAVHYIPKPFGPDELALKVREILAAPRCTGRILVVDDDESIRSLFRQVLEGAGYEVLLASDGGEALRLLREHAVEVVLTDLVMPEREGIETIQTIRKEYPALKIIAVSGAFGGSLLRIAQALGAGATLAKPVSPEQLLTTVQKILG